MCVCVCACMVAGSCTVCGACWEREKFLAVFGNQNPDPPSSSLHNTGLTDKGQCMFLATLCL